MPRVREIGRELGLTDPWEANAPVSLAHPQPVRIPQPGEPVAAG